MKGRVQFDQLLAPQQAGILSNDPRFRKFTAVRTGAPTETCTSSAAAEYIRQICRIKSRAELQDNEDARRRFGELRTEFDRWRGRIADVRR